MVDTLDLSFLIVAGGSGMRMGGDTPKQYIELLGKPVLCWTITHLLTALPGLPRELVLIVPRENMEYVRELVAKHCDVMCPLRIGAGGSSRYESVWNGLQICSSKYVAIHDGVRPFVSKRLMGDLWGAMLEGARAAVPFLPMVDSVRSVDGGENRFVPREKIVSVQTPQCFPLSVLRDAYEQFMAQPNESLTDEASILSETSGVQPFLIPGDRENIKLTYPLDLVMTEYILRQW